ncbi:hypothetical protein ACTZWW_10860 [Salinarimonas sp. NSM]|uniref:hypothetical protein n=1 Tax=Salinarimonas sp. NSM TaxID=3458003 RepID=UPI00403527D3
MDWANFLEAQNVMTIGLVLVLAIGLFAFFLRRKSNRTAAANAFSGDPERSALARKAERSEREPGPADGASDTARPPR